jgi:hypothetical protein
MEFSLSYYLGLKQLPAAPLEESELATVQALQDGVRTLLNQLDAIDPRSLLSLRDGFYFAQSRKHQSDTLKQITEKLKNFSLVAEHAIDDIRREWRVDPDTHHRAITQVKTLADNTRNLVTQFATLSPSTTLLLYEHLLFKRTPPPQDYFEAFKTDLADLSSAFMHAAKKDLVPMAKEEQLWSRLFAICANYRLKTGMADDPFEPIAALVQTLSGLDIEKDDAIIRRISGARQHDEQDPAR